MELFWRALLEQRTWRRAASCAGDDASPCSMRAGTQGLRRPTGAKSGSPPKVAAARRPRGRWGIAARGPAETCWPARAIAVPSHLHAPGCSLGAALAAGRWPPAAGLVLGGFRQPRQASDDARKMSRISPRLAGRSAQRPAAASSQQAASVLRRPRHARRRRSLSSKVCADPPPPPSRLAHRLAAVIQELRPPSIKHRQRSDDVGGNADRRPSRLGLMAGTASNSPSPLSALQPFRPVAPGRAGAPALYHPGLSTLPARSAAISQLYRPPGCAEIAHAWPAPAQWHYCSSMANAAALPLAVCGQWS